MNQYVLYTYIVRVLYTYPEDMRWDESGASPVPMQLPRNSWLRTSIFGWTQCNYIMATRGHHGIAAVTAWGDTAWEKLCMIEPQSATAGNGEKCSVVWVVKAMHSRWRQWVRDPLFQIMGFQTARDGWEWYFQMCRLCMFQEGQMWVYSILLYNIVKLRVNFPPLFSFCQHCVQHHGQGLTLKCTHDLTFKSYTSHV